MEYVLYALAGMGVLATGVLIYLFIKFILPIIKVIRVAKQATGIESWGEMMNSPLQRLLGELPDPETPVMAMADPEWDDAGKIAAAVAEFEQKGFSKVGAFYGLDYINMAVLLLRDDGAIAWVGEEGDDDEVVQCGLIGFTNDDSSISVSNSNTSPSLPAMPGETRIQRSTEGIERLVEAFGEEIAGRSLKTIASKDLAEVLQQFKQRRIWHLASHPDALDVVLEDKEGSKGMMVTSVRDSLADIITACCREEFLNTSGISATDWDKKRDHLVFVHDHLVGKELLEEENTEDLDMDDMEDFDWDKINEDAGAPLDREKYSKHYENFPEARKPELIARLERPVPCDVYLTKEY